MTLPVESPLADLGLSHFLILVCRVTITRLDRIPAESFDFFIILYGLSEFKNS
ncbi:hypothetical protein GCM10028816_53610 [Spirosoma lituiforme]